MADVRAQSIFKSFGKVEVLKDINLDVENGSFTVLVGPSGCGKSTLLRCIAGLETVDQGELLIDGQRVNNLAPAKREIAMVFQSYALYPHKNVEDNMAFGLRFAKTPKDEINARVAEAARMLQLEPLLKRRPRELSGGQRQRVAIGRAIVRKPKVFLFDEPLSNLDAALRINTRVEIAKLHKQLKATIIYVTHDQVEAMTLADKIVVMNQGRIEQAGKPLDLYYKPTNLFVAGFIGSPGMNFMKAEVSGNAFVLQDGTALKLEIPKSLNLGDKVTIGIRPEHMRIVEKGQSDLKGSVDIVERMGETGYVHLKLPDQSTVIAEIRGAAPQTFDNKLGVIFDRDQIHIFDAAGNRVSDFKGL